MITNNSALFAFIAAIDQRLFEGYFVDASGVIVTSAFAVPHGVIVDASDIGQLTTAALPNFSGLVTVKVASSTGTIIAGTRLQLNADGTVKADMGTGRIVAIAAEPGTADERIQAFLLPSQVANPFVLVDVDGASLLADQSGGIISNKGAVAAAVFALPAALPGMNFTFLVEAAYELRVDPNGTETIALPSTGVQSAAGKYIAADALGEKVKLVCLTAGTWSVEHYSGTWTAEA